MTATEQ